MVRALRVYTLSYSFALVGALFATWIAARLTLGHWPRPSLDDPKEIGRWVDIPYDITCIFLVVGFPLFVAAVAALVFYAFRSSSERTRLLTSAVLSIAVMVGVVLFLRWDPLEISNWFMD